MSTTKRIKTIAKSAPVIVTAPLVSDQWFDANPNAKPIDPTDAVGARNTGRYSGKNCVKYQLWYMMHCTVADRRTDAEICDHFTVEFLASSHVQSHRAETNYVGTPRFPIATVRAMRREYNAGKRGPRPTYPIPEWFANADNTRDGWVQFRDTITRKLLPAVPFDPPTA